MRFLSVLLAASASAWSAVAQPPAQAELSKPILNQTDVEILPAAADASEQPYPVRAQIVGIGGVATVLCDIDAKQSLSCLLESEDPENFGFGAAAVRMFNGKRVKPLTRAGQRASGKQMRVVVNFTQKGSSPVTITAAPRIGR